MAKKVQESLAKPTDNSPPCPHCMPETRIGSATESTAHLTQVNSIEKSRSVQSRARRNPTGYGGRGILKRALDGNCGKSYVTTAKDPAFGTLLPAYSRHDRPLVGDPNYRVAEENHYKEAVKRHVWKGVDDAWFTPGYTGFIPREQFIYGKTFQKACVQAIAHLEESLEKYPHN